MWRSWQQQVILGKSTLYRLSGDPFPMSANSQLPCFLVGCPFEHWQPVFLTMGQPPSIPSDLPLGFIFKNGNKFNPRRLTKKCPIFLVMFPGLSTNSQIKRYGPSMEPILIILFVSLTAFAGALPDGWRSHICKPSRHCPPNPDLCKN